MLSSAPRTASTHKRQVTSKCLQKLDQCFLFFRRQFGAPEVPLIRVAGCARIEPEILFGFRSTRNEADPFLVVDVITAPEKFWPLVGRQKEICQCRHRTVVQVRCAQPETI